MAHFDPERGEIVVRIVYDGPATAGKTANLRSLHATFASRATGDIFIAPETRTGRTLYFDWLELLVGYLDDWPLRCQVLTVPGQLALAERRFRLLQELDAVVVVCESSSPGVRAGRVALAFLRSILAVTGNEAIPLVCQANKQDLAHALSAEEVAARLGLPEGAQAIPASAVGGDGVRSTFLAALAGAREGLRARLRSGGLAAIGSKVARAEQLYQAMLAEADAAPSETLTDALDRALALVEVE